MKIIKYWSLPKQIFDSLIVLTDESKNISFDDVQTREEVFTQIKNGDKAALTTKEYTPLTAAFQPIIALLVCGAITYFVTWVQRVLPKEEHRK